MAGAVGAEREIVSITIDERISRYMERVDPAVSGQHGHTATFLAARVLIQGFGLSTDQAWPFALTYNARCMPPWSERDLRRKLDQALVLKSEDKPRGYLLGEDVSGYSTETARPTKPKLEYEPEKLATVASALSDDISAAYLETRSRFTCWNRSPAGFLHKLYKPGEKVVVFDVFKSQGCEVWEHPGISGNLATLDYLQKGHENVWYMANPVDGEYHWNPREGHDSRRSEESVTSWRYAVIESDDAPKHLWLRALVQLPLPIAAIYDSAGDSIHALVVVDALSKSDWDRIVREELAPIIVPLGADLGAMTAVRLSRLPNCRREETGRIQALLYLNPEPDYTPIAQRPVRKASNGS
jgi:hypothetical protein